MSCLLLFPNNPDPGYSKNQQLSWTTVYLNFRMSTSDTLEILWTIKFLNEYLIYLKSQMNFKKSYNRIFNDCSSGNSILLVMIDKLQLNSRERTNVKTPSSTSSMLSQTWVCRIPTRTVLRYLELILYIKKPTLFSCLCIFLLMV